MPARSLRPLFQSSLPYPTAEETKNEKRVDKPSSANNLPVIPTLAYIRTETTRLTRTSIVAAEPSTSPDRSRVSEKLICEMSNSSVKDDRESDMFNMPAILIILLAFFLSPSRRCGRGGELPFVASCHAFPSFASSSSSLVDDVLSRRRVHVYKFLSGGWELAKVVVEPLQTSSQNCMDDEPSKI